MRRDTEDETDLSAGTDIMTEDIAHLVRTYGLASLLMGMRRFLESEADECEERSQRRLYSAMAGQMDAACMDARALEGL